MLYQGARLFAKKAMKVNDKSFHSKCYDVASKKLEEYLYFTLITTALGAFGGAACGALYGSFSRGRDAKSVYHAKKAATVLGGIANNFEEWFINTLYFTGQYASYGAAYGSIPITYPLMKAYEVMMRDNEVIPIESLSSKQISVPNKSEPRTVITSSKPEHDLTKSCYPGEELDVCLEWHEKTETCFKWQER